MTGVLPTLTLLAMLSLPAGWLLLRSAERAFIGSIGEINRIDLRTARLHATFGVLLILGIILTRSLP